MAKRKMIAKIQYNYKDRGPNYEIDMSIDLGRFEKQYCHAQYELDSMIMTSMIPYMPMQTGTFINVTRAMSSSIAGSGKVVAAAPPMGRFLYEGETMVGMKSRSAWAKKGEKKEVNGKSLQYSRHAHPNATDHWFEKAKERDVDRWAAKAKKIAGGG